MTEEVILTIADAVANDHLEGIKAFRERRPAQFER